SAQTAADYYWRFREAELPVIGVDPTTPPTAPRRPRQRVRGETGQRERPSPRPRARRESSLVIPEPRNSRVRFDFDRRALERAEDRNRRRRSEERRVGKDRRPRGTTTH